MARPKAVINLELVERLAAVQCTEAEIAAILGIDKSTLVRRKAREPGLRQAIDRGRSDGKASLRRAQWKTALGGNATMLIWLGKQHLAQSDRPEHKPETDESGKGDEAAEMVRDAEEQRSRDANLRLVG